MLVAHFYLSEHEDPKLMAILKKSSPEARMNDMVCKHFGGVTNSSFIRGKPATKKLKTSTTRKKFVSKLH